MGNCNQRSTESGRNQSGNGDIQKKPGDHHGKYSAPDHLEENRNSHSTLENIKLHEGSVLYLDSYNQWIGSCSDDQSIALSDINSIMNSHTYSPVVIKEHQKAVNRLIFHTENNELNMWSASRDLSIKLWSVPNPADRASISLRQEIKNSHTLNITAIDNLQSHRGLLASGSRDYSLKLWDTATFHCTREYKVSRNIITALASTVEHPDIIFQSSEDLTIKLWDYRSPDQTLPSASITGFVYFPLTLDLHSSGNYIAAGCKGFNAVGCNVFVFDIRKLPSTKNFNNNFLFSGGADHDFKGHSQDVTSCKFSRINSQFLYSCSKDGSIFVWNTVDGTHVCYKFPKKYITSFCFISKEFIDHPRFKVDNQSIEFFAIGCIDGSVVFMSYDFLNKKFDIIKSTATSMDNEEIEY